MYTLKILIPFFSFTSNAAFSINSKLENLQHVIESAYQHYAIVNGLVAIAQESTSDRLTNKLVDEISNLDLFIMDLMGRMQLPRIYYNFESNFVDMGFGNKPDIYVLATSGERFVDIMKYIRRLNHWSPQAKFIIIYYNHNRSLDWDSIASILYRNYVFDVIVTDLNNRDDILTFCTYNPYRNENLNAPDLSAIRLQFNGSIEQLYFNKFPSAWRNSSVQIAPVELPPYVISVADQTGIDIEVTHLLNHKLQSDMLYGEKAYFDWGRKLENGSYSSVYGMLEKGQTDFMIGNAHFRNPENLIDFDYTFSYTQDPLIWAVPCPVPISNLTGIILIFSKYIWAAIIVSLLASIIAWQIIGRIMEKDTYFGSWYAVEIPFRLFIGLGIPCDPRRLSARIMFLASWSFGFIVITTWLSHLTDFMTHIVYEERIKSVEEMIDRKLVLGLHSELATMYYESGDDLGKYIGTHFTDCDLSGSCWQRVSYKKDMSTITTLRCLRYISYDRYMSNKGEQLMIPIQDVYVNMDFTVMYFPKGHPLCTRVSQLLMRITESGWINYIDVHINYKQAITNRRELFNPNQLETKKLTLHDVQISFAVLLGGLLIATAAFVGEKFQQRSNKYRSHKKFADIT